MTETYGTMTTDHELAVAAELERTPTYTAAQYRDALAAHMVTYRQGMIDVTERLRTAQRENYSASYRQGLCVELTAWQAQLDAIRSIMGYLTECGF